MLNRLDEEVERVRAMLSSGEVPSPVAEKITTGLAEHRDKLEAELAALEET